VAPRRHWVLSALGVSVAALLLTHRLAAVFTPAGPRPSRARPCPARQRAGPTSRNRARPERARARPGRPGLATALLADSVSSALPVQARNVRLVRVGAADLALQFEFFKRHRRQVQPVRPRDGPHTPT